MEITPEMIEAGAKAAFFEAAKECHQFWFTGLDWEFARETGLSDDFIDCARACLTAALKSQPVIDNTPKLG